MSAESWLVVAAVIVALAVIPFSLGEARLTALDAWVRRTIRGVSRITLSVARVFGVLLLLGACLFGIAALGFLVDSVLAMIASGAFSALVMLLVVFPLSLYLAFHSLKLQAKLTLRLAATYVHTWRETVGSSPPWPFSWFDRPEPRQRDAFLLMFLLVPVVLLHIAAFAGVLAVGAIILPFSFVRLFTAERA